ncbi:uncharacterized protein LOC109012658 isoform X2 [Juglans regia]|nr:uncharacterized protein LOC109012658 isoform X2 [Juglans regia]XP_018849956.2 uncharacterized protein LOC109012658 isoform X2 [Juglans regia]XP_018849957.2 uncharacterized protein LOC109012658 isoform X2 [Juglans regia]
MENPEHVQNISVVWRGKKFTIEMGSGATLKELGLKLQGLTDVKADTMRLIVPQSSNKTSKLLSPFSDEQAFLSLEEISITKGKSIRMMGVPGSEVDEILQNAKANLRVAGFEEEEKRLRQRMSDRPHASPKPPQGPYIFCHFRTLEIPGIEMNPPASEALKRMHMLAADPGIVAIMNKHHWRVGIMTELAPIGYVGISPKCLLGFNKNHGEEISLRLRTDDLKGFRKYESIKKTLLHELAHMVHSEHDENFYALDKQLNQEAASLDWTRSRSRTLNGVRYSGHYEDDDYIGDSSNTPQKLGGSTLDQLANARASSVAAAYRRLSNASVNTWGGSVASEEPDPDDSGLNTHGLPASMDSMENENFNTNIQSPNEAQIKPVSEPDSDNLSGDQNKLEPNPCDSQYGETMDSEFYPEFTGNRTVFGQGFSNYVPIPPLLPSETNRKLGATKLHEEPDPDKNQEMEILDTGIQTRKDIDEPDPDDSQANGAVQTEPDPDDKLGHAFGVSRMQTYEPDPDDSQANGAVQTEPDPDDKLGHAFGVSRMQTYEPDPDDSQANGAVQTEPDPDDKLGHAFGVSRMQTYEPDPDDSQANGAVQTEPDPDDKLGHAFGVSRMQTYEPDPDDQELQRIQDPVTFLCSRLKKAIEMLQVEVTPLEATAVLQTLSKIIRNVIEHPGEMKYRRLRKANPIIQKNVTNYQAAMDILSLIGFNEDVVLDEIGKAETYLVLKRNDPGLLWLAKSSLETAY